MKLLVGLGNPGKKYQATWHNVGFMVVDLLKDKEFDQSSKFKNSTKFKAEICEGEILGEKIILTKPKTFMNNSGQAVSALVNFYKIKPEDLWLIHDDIDLPLAKIRISQNSSAAGHKGVQSVIDNLGLQNFVRFRIGIRSEKPLKIPTEKYVLQKIDKPGKIVINQTIEKILTAIEVTLDQGVTEAMNQFN